MRIAVLELTHEAPVKYDDLLSEVRREKGPLREGVVADLYYACMVRKN